MCVDERENRESKWCMSDDDGALCRKALRHIGKEREGEGDRVKREF